MEIVTRAEWGAKPPHHAYHRIDRYQPRLILHHAAGAVLPGDDSVSPKDLTRIRSIQSFHQNGRGWNDIAYSYLHDPDGNLLEGRGAGVANGATKGYGASSYAICVMGNFDTQAPDDDLIQGLAATVRWGYEAGLWPLGFTGGHRNYGATSCPGSKLYPLIPEINRLAQEEDMPSIEELEEMTRRVVRDELDRAMDGTPTKTGNWGIGQRVISMPIGRIKINDKPASLAQLVEEIWKATRNLV